MNPPKNEPSKNYFIYIISNKQQKVCDMDPVLVTVEERKQCYEETLTKKQYKLHAAFHKLCCQHEP